MILSKMLITNETSNIKNSNKLIKNFVKPKTRKSTKF